MTTRPDDPDEARIVEYVVGTLASAERQAFTADMERDASLRVRVLAWEEHLAPLAEGVGSVEPSSGLWPRIAGMLGPAVTGVIDGGRRELHDIAVLRRSRAVWRGIAVGAGSMAALLALFVASDRLVPKAPQPGLVAVVNRSGELPALIIRVDQAAGTVQVRSLSTETPAGHSLELWSIVGQEKPRSLGLVAPGATRVSVPASDRARLDGATLAVTVEPAGGTGDRGPTGPVVYSGKLVPERE